MLLRPSLQELEDPSSCFLFQPQVVGLATCEVGASFEAYHTPKPPPPQQPQEVDPERLSSRSSCSSILNSAFFNLSFPRNGVNTESSTWSSIALVLAHFTCAHRAATYAHTRWKSGDSFFLLVLPRHPGFVEAIGIHQKSTKKQP
jgi:hypothetical protein